MRVAVLDEYPWLRKTPHGFEGPAWRIAQEVARRLGVGIQTSSVGFHDKVSIVASGRVDMTIAPLLITPERQKVVDIVPYSTSAQCLIGRRDNPKVARARAVDDLDRADVTFAYIVGSPQGAWLRRRLPRARPLGVPGNLADVPVAEILARRADVTTIDKFFVQGLRMKTAGIATVPKAFLASRELPIPIGMAVSKGQPAFLDWLRAVAKGIQPQVVAEEHRIERAGP